MKKIVLLIFGLVASSIFAGDLKPLPIQAKIENGLIEGFTDTSSGLKMFFGVPFAKPPVAELRWKVPQALDNWTGVLKTVKFSPRPVQIEVYGKMNNRNEAMSEDCLYLNVWAPTKTSTKPYPVLVYFYGGGFAAGDATEPRYDGAAMAKKGIIVVTANYRLNIFGFLAHPELSKEAPYNSSGNYGFLDQNAALKWVQRNIAAFGGDARRVTIAGESAGSISVCSQMASPLSKNLFSAAIGESGGFIKTIPLAQAESKGVEFTEKAGCKTIVALRGLSTQQIVDFYTKNKRYGFNAVIDGYFLTKSFAEIFKAKEQAQVPLLVGWNSEEMPALAFLGGTTYTPEIFKNKVKEIYPKDYEEILNLYPHATEKEVLQSATDLASDRFIAYNTWCWFDMHRKNSSQPVYRYLFCHPRPLLKDKNLVSGLAGGTQKKEEKTATIPKKIGAAHADEIEYFMGNLPLEPEFDFTSEDFKVSKTSQEFISNFIKTGNPNEKKLPYWPVVKPNEANPQLMFIDIISKAKPAPHDNRYLFLSKNNE